MRVVKTSNKATATLTRIGMVSIGEKHPTQCYPMALDYFKFRPQSDALRRVEDIKKRIGEKPNAITVVFPTDDINYICPEYLELRDYAGKVFARGDGQDFEVCKKDGATVVYKAYKFEDYSKKNLTANDFMQGLLEEAIKQAKAAKPDIKEANLPKWKHKLTLRFLVCGIPYLGIWELNTFGVSSSIPGIVSYLDNIRQMSGGRLSNIPFELCIKKVSSDKAGDGKRYPVLSIFANLSPEKLELVQSLGSNVRGLLTEQKLDTLLIETPIEVEVIEE